MDSYIAKSEKTYAFFYSPENEGGSSPDNQRKEIDERIRPGYNFKGPREGEDFIQGIMRYEMGHRRVCPSEPRF